MMELFLHLSPNETAVLIAFVSVGILVLLSALVDHPTEHTLHMSTADLVALIWISDEEHEVWVRTKSGLIINYTITREVFNKIVDMIDHERINDITA